MGVGLRVHPRWLLWHGRLGRVWRRASTCDAGGVQVLVDADNVPVSRLRVVAAALAELPDAVARIVVAGRSSAVDALDWPEHAVIVRIAGWQEADLALADAYVADREPLLLVSCDGDFGLLAARHSGPVLVVSTAASGRLRDAARVVDPVLDGGRGLRDWLTAAEV